ncbi:MAG TPA: ornithine carbamoyltransferase [Acidimicrobiales bacterium]|nr:ornithine carbamoyltransferase [Acidimicrobiales bacterium]
MARHFLEVDDLKPDELGAVLGLAGLAEPRQVMTGRGMALLFEKPSARTRSSTELAVVQLGGHPVYIQGQEVGIDSREPAEDVARVLASYHSVIGARVLDHATLERMVGCLDAAGVDVPVVNLLSDRAHPCQALADLLTIRHSLGRLEGVTVAYVGDANNVCRSLMQACALVGAAVRVATPEGYGPSDDDTARAEAAGGDVVVTRSPAEAVAGADVVYTDVWTSMGQEDEAAVRRAAFAGYTVDEALMSGAASGAIVLHCLPAHRGEEISAAVVDGPQSRVWDQAANRMHAVRGLLLWLMGERPE